MAWQTRFSSPWETPSASNVLFDAADNGLLNQQVIGLSGAGLALPFGAALVGRCAAGVATREPKRPPGRPRWPEASVTCRRRRRAPWLPPDGSPHRRTHAAPPSVPRSRRSINYGRRMRTFPMGDAMTAVKPVVGAAPETGRSPYGRSPTPLGGPAASRRTRGCCTATWCSGWRDPTIFGPGRVPSHSAATRSRQDAAAHACEGGGQAADRRGRSAGGGS
jgi:hypothetical protein